MKGTQLTLHDESPFPLRTGTARGWYRTRVQDVPAAVLDRLQGEMEDKLLGGERLTERQQAVWDYIEENRRWIDSELAYEGMPS